MAAMTSERNPAEIRELSDLRRFARRLYALKVLLPRHAREIGIHEAERVAKGIETTRRQALIERIRQIKVLETLNPSKEQISAYYAAHKDLYVRAERISILEILVDTRTQADSLLAAIERGGDFGDLARRYSRRSTRIRRAEGRIQLLRPDKYGNLGWEAKTPRSARSSARSRPRRALRSSRCSRKFPVTSRAWTRSGAGCAPICCKT